MRRFALLAALIVAGCNSPFAPSPPEDAVPFSPPPRFEQMYEEMEECSGIKGDFDAVEWYVVPDIMRWESTANGSVVVGEWWKPNSIYLAGARIGHWTEHDLVAHEILHHLLQDQGHPVPPFETCAPVSL